MSRCEICIDKRCKGEKNCNCETCDKKDICYRVLKPTIRITNKCTERCEHCCFSSGPESNLHMSVEKAQEINIFLEKNGIKQINLMGGEFFCNPQWEYVMGCIVKGLDKVRVVSNSDWAGNEKEPVKVISFFGSNRNCYLALSKDEWHTNKNVSKAVEILSENRISHVVSDTEEKYDHLVPTGRNKFETGFYGMFGCYCDNPEKLYSFLIDEVGNIHKCPMGGLIYANTEEYLEGGFCHRFVDIGEKFRKAMIMSCRQCRRIIDKLDKEKGYDYGQL